MTAKTGLLCPKCGGQMRSYDRSGILVEQCEDCRGIFLDHGELERLIDVEGGGWSGRIEQPAALPRQSRDEHEADRRRGEGADHRPEHDGARVADERPHRETRLGNLLDLFGDD